MKADPKKGLDEGVEAEAGIELDVIDSRSTSEPAAHAGHDALGNNADSDPDSDPDPTDEEATHFTAESEVLVTSDLDPRVEPKIQLSWWRRLLSPGVQLYLVAMFMGAVMQALSKLAVERVDVFVAVQVRMALTLVIALSYMQIKGIKHGFWGEPAVRKLLFFRGLLGFLNISMTYYALIYLSLPDKAILAFLNPIVTGILSRIILHESYVWQQLVCGFVALLGVIIIARPSWLFQPSEGAVPVPPVDAIHRLYAVIATLIVVVSAAVVMIVLRKIGTRAHALASVTNYNFVSLAGATIFIGYEIVSGSPDVSYPENFQTWILLVAVGLTGFVLQFLTAKAIQLEQASILSSFRPTQLVWMVVLEALIWHDLPDIWTVSGGIIILASVSYAATFKKEPKNI